MKGKVKKSFINILWWILFSVSAIFLSIQASGVVGYWLNGQPPLLIGLFFGVMLLLGTAVFFISRGIGGIWANKIWSGRETPEKKRSERFLLVLTEISFWILLGYLLVLRIFSAALAGTGDLSLFRQAMVGRGEIPGEMMSGLTKLYVDLLSLLFSFLGNKEAVVIYLQIILQSVTVILLYFALRLLCGRIAAYTASLLIACSARWVVAMTVVGPEVFYLFLWSLALLLIAVCCHTMVVKERSLKVRRCGILVAGILCGILVYFDLLGLLLVAVSFYLLLPRGKEKKVFNFLINKILLLMGIGLGGFVMFFRETVIQSNVMGDNLRRWLEQHWFERMPTVISMPVMEIPPEPVILLAALALGGCFLAAAFWWGGQPGTAAWILMMLLVCVIAPTFKIALLDHAMWLMLVWAVLAGLGLQAMIKVGLSRKIKSIKAGKTEAEKLLQWKKIAVTEDASNQSIAIEEALREETVTAETASKESVDVEPVNKETAGAESITEKTEVVKEENKKARNATQPKGRTEKVTEAMSMKKNNKIVNITTRTVGQPETSRYDTSTGVKYLDNPLPLPRKPMRKGMDYPHRIAPDKMHYDIEISERDDYDI